MDLGWRQVYLSKIQMRVGLQETEQVPVFLVLINALSLSYQVGSTFGEPSAIF